MRSLADVRRDQSLDPYTRTQIAQATRPPIDGLGTD